MNALSRLLSPALLVLTLSANAQTNARMPPVKDLVTQFFYSYMEPASPSSYYFQKKAGGWYVCMRDHTTGTYTTPQLYWSKEQHRYLVLDLTLQNNPDSATVAALIADYAKRYLLTTDDMIRYDRNLYYGYDGWDQDVIRTLEATPPTTDSLWESLSLAYDNQAGNFVVPESFRKMGYNQPDISKFIEYESKAIMALRHIYSSNPGYRCGFHDIGWQLNTILMATATTLSWLGADSLAVPFIRATNFPAPVLQKTRQLLHQLPANAILFTDKDTTTFPVAYLLAKGERPDIVAIDNLFFLLRSPATELRIRPITNIPHATYQDSAFQYAMYQPDGHDTGTHSLDTVLAALYSSPDAAERPSLDPSFGRLYRYFTLHSYLINKKGDRIEFDLPEKYLLIQDILDLDIVANNYNSRRIFFTHPAEHPLFKPFCQQVGLGLYEFIPKLPSTSHR